MYYSCAKFLEKTVNPALDGAPGRFCSLNKKCHSPLFFSTEPA